MLLRNTLIAFITLLFLACQSEKITDTMEGIAATEPIATSFNGLHQFILLDENGNLFDKKTIEQGKQYTFGGISYQKKNLYYFKVLAFEEKPNQVSQQIETIDFGPFNQKMELLSIENAVFNKKNDIKDIVNMNLGVGVISSASQSKSCLVIPYPHQKIQLEDIDKSNISGKLFKINDIHYLYVGKPAERVKQKPSKRDFGNQKDAATQ